MILQEYINKWNNQKQERVDSSNLNQCFDLAVGYCIDVLGLPQSIFSGLVQAYEIWTKPTQSTSSTFDFIVNTPYAMPKAGDIVIFSNKYGPSGHVAVVVKADVNTITTFSQNDPTGSPCVMKTYPYTFVLGWLRKISDAIAGESVTQLQQQVQDLKETEKRLQREKDEAVQSIQAEMQRQLAEKDSKCLKDIAFNRQQARSEVVNSVIEFCKKQ